MKKYPSKRRRFIQFALFLISCIAVVVMLRHAFAGLAVGAISRYLFPKEQGSVIEYSSVRWEGSVISVAGFEVNSPQGRLKVERFELILGLRPHLWVIHPSWVVKSQEKGSGKPASKHNLAMLKLLKLDVVEGRLATANVKGDYEENKFFFSLESEETRDLSCRLKCYKEPDGCDHPFAEACIAWIDNQVKVEVEAKTATTQEISALLHLVQPNWSQQLKTSKGTWDLQLRCSMSSKGELMGLKGQMSALGIVLESSKGWQFEAEELQIMLASPERDSQRAWHRAIDIEAALAGGAILLHDAEKQYHFKDLAGHLSWQKTSDPKFHLEGNLILDGVSEKVLAFGNGQIEDSGGFWLKSELLLGEKERAVAMARISVVNDEENRLDIDAEVSQAKLPFLKQFSDNFGWTSPTMFSVVEGDVSGACHCVFKNGYLVRVDLKPTVIKQAIVKKQDEFLANAISLQLDGRWELVKEEKWKTQILKGSVLSETIVFSAFKQLPLKDISGEFSILEGEIEQSCFKANVQEIPLELIFSGALSRPSCQFLTSTTWSSFTKILSFLGLPIKRLSFGEEILEGTFGLEALDKDYAASLQINMGNEGKLEGNWTLKKDKIEAGVLKATKFPLAPLLSAFTKELNGKGSIDLEGKFDGQGGEALVGLKEIEVETKDWLVGVAEASTGHMKWGAYGKDVQFQVPVRSASCTFKNDAFSLTKLSAFFTATEKQARLDDLEFLCEGIKFKGEAAIHEQGASIISKDIRGNLSDLSRLLRSNPKFPQLPQGIQGRFHVKEKGLSFELPSRSIALKVGIEEAFIPLGSMGALDHIATELSYDSKESVIGLNGLQGDFRVDQNKRFRVIFQPFTLSKQDEELAGIIEGCLKSGDAILLHCMGQLKITSKESRLELLTSKSQLLGSPLEKGTLKIGRNGVACRIAGQFKLEEAASIAQLLNASNIWKTGVLPTLMHGHCAYQFSWESSANRWEAMLKSNNIGFENTEFKDISVHVRKELKKLYFDEIVWDDCKAQAEITFDRLPEYPFSYFVTSPSWNSSGDGKLNLSQRKLELLPKIELTFQNGENYTLKPKSSVLIDFSKDQYITATNGKWEEPKTRSSVEVSKALWNRFEKKFEIDNVKFRIAESLVKKRWPDIKFSSGWVEGSAQVSKDLNGFEAAGSLVDGEYGWQKYSTALKSIQWRVSPKNLLLGGKTELGEANVVGTLQVDLTEKLAQFKLQQQGKNSALSFLVRMQQEDGPIIERFSGEIAGIRADMKNVGKNRTILRGKLDVNFDELLQVVPKAKRRSWQKIKAGKGYGFEGDLAFTNGSLWQAEGRIYGHDFVLFNTEFSEMEGKVQLSPRRLLVKQLQISEGDFHLTVPQFGIEEIPEQAWMLNCPLIQVKDLQPSRLRKIGEKDKPLKPFVVRNLTITDMRGELDHPETYKGSCALQFINAGKKEANIFDIPLNMLKDLGLEPSLLIPIQGELLGRIEGGRLLFTDLKGAYSEGRRTQFALSNRGDGSYIDFDGKLHIDLMMRQAVLIKIIESLTLGIRGNLEKPHYLLLP